MTSSAGSPRRRTRAALDLEGLRAELARRAADEGLLDVAYGFADSPLGPLTVIVTPRGSSALSYAREAVDEQLEEIATRVSPRILASPERTDAVRRQLDEYFAGDRRRFDVPIDWRLVRGFTGDVLRATARIPFGSRVELPRGRHRGGLAERATARPATRSARTRSRSSCPATASCTPAAGLGGYTGGLERKRYLLRLEGVLEGNDPAPISV